MKYLKAISNINQYGNDIENSLAFVPNTMTLGTSEDVLYDELVISTNRNTAFWNIIKDFGYNRIKTDGLTRYECTQVTQFIDNNNENITLKDLHGNFDGLEKNLFPNITSCHNLFSETSWDQSINIKTPKFIDTSNCTDFSNMYCKCRYGTIDVSSLDTSNGENFYEMFWSCNYVRKLDLRNFRTPKATNMARMFSSCNSVQELDLSSFDTSNVTNIYRMFYYCDSLCSLNLSNWDTSKVQIPEGATRCDTFQSCFRLTGEGACVYLDNTTQATFNFIKQELINTAKYPLLQRDGVTYGYDSNISDYIART